MRPTKTEIENEIAKLAAFLNNTYKSYLKLQQRIEVLVRQAGAFNNAINSSKPILKRQKIEWELRILKFRLSVLERRIRKSREDRKRGEKSSNEKSG